MSTPFRHFFLAAALALAALPATAQSARCGKDFATVGESRVTVLLRCGEPLLRDAHCRPNARRAPGVVHGRACEAIEDWVYKPGGGQFVTTLRFEAGVLREIVYGDRIP